jgi:hypothetical protein
MKAGIHKTDEDAFGQIIWSFYEDKEVFSQ